MAEESLDAVTFLFTDIEGSTRRWEEFPETMNRAVARHDYLLRQAIETNQGRVFKTVGDAFCASFASPVCALVAVLAAQRAVESEDWGAVGPIRVRMSVHTGSARVRDNDYFGPTLNRVARLLSLGYGGQTLVSGTTEQLVASTMPEEARLLDLGEHRLKDLVRGERVFQLQAPGLLTDFPALKSLNRRTHNLPISPTPLIGRDADLAAVLGLLGQPGVRLLTLSGPGGTGKTRLSLQVAAEALDNLVVGAYFVELDSVTTQEGLVGAIAHALGHSEMPLQGLIELLNGEFGGRKLLLVLDNFEQVTEAATAISQILAACSGTRFLATSRALLRIRGERDYPLLPLALPAPNALLSPSALAAYPAVDLFTQRAQATKPSFEITAENVAAVVEICRKLDGLPLAIELAASRVKMLAPAQLLGYLENRLKLLTGGARDLPERQRTLRGAIDWSYHMLPAGEAALFRQLAVFAGGWDMEAALQVCQLGPDAEVDVFDGLASLVEKSLVRQEDQGQEVRFMMLGTIREYALEALDAAEPGKDTRARHAQFYEGLASRLPTQEAARPDMEHDNWRAALLHLAQQPEAAGRAGSMAVALCPYWERTGRYHEAREHLERSLHALLAAADSLQPQDGLVLCSQLAGWLGWFAFLQHELGPARQFQEQSLALAREANNPASEADALNNLAMLAHHEGDLAQARGWFESSLAITERLADGPKQAARLSNLGLLAIQEQRFEPARESLLRALQIYEGTGDAQGSAACCCNLAELALRQANWAEAAAQADRALFLFEKLGDKRGVIFSRINAAEAALGQQDFGLALAGLTSATTLAWEAQLRPILPVLLEQRARALVGLGQVARAHEAWAGAAQLRLAWDLPLSDHEAEVLQPVRVALEAEGEAPMLAARTLLAGKEPANLLSHLLAS